MNLNETTVESAALTPFGEPDYAIDHGPHIAPGESAAERDSFGDVVLEVRVPHLRPPARHAAAKAPLRRVAGERRRAVSLARSLTSSQRGYHKDTLPDAPGFRASSDGVGR